MPRAGVATGAADVAGVDEAGPSALHLGHEGVVAAAVVGQVGADRHREGGLGRSRSLPVT